MKAKLTQNVKALANGVAVESERPAMGGVLINKNEAVVSDSFILVIKPLPAPEMNLESTPDDGINEVIVPADALKACKGDEVYLETIEQIRTSVSELDAITGNNKKIVARLNGVDFSVEADSIQDKYPDYKAIFGVSPIVAQIAFNTKVFKKLLKCLPDESLLQMRISEPDKMVEFQAVDPDGGLPIRGLVSPMHASWIGTKWNTKDAKGATDVIGAVIDAVATEKTAEPKEGENTITIKGAGKEVTVTDKQFKDAAKKIIGKKKTDTDNTENDKAGV